ncbi:hypothetical protein BKA70DRAFT_1231106 [Coprinopsis sp. MPI-PUGE-AT-0042]|nr:hypothetical protein BKA70DRAFT_1231106 [Coprinopsis sp. MPI-PUGE-AT-0042]
MTSILVRLLLKFISRDYIWWPLPPNAKSAASRFPHAPTPSPSASQSATDYPFITHRKSTATPGEARGRDKDMGMDMEWREVVGRDTDRYLHDHRRRWVSMEDSRRSSYKDHEDPQDHELKSQTHPATAKKKEVEVEEGEQREEGQ